ncbi:MAG: serine hydrolase, partial [Bacteroidetes bacterium]|nr:serine hydrolase [Bacteroidota bacterium]
MNRFLTTLCMLLAFAVFTNAQTRSKILTEAPPEAGGFSAARLTRLDSAMNAWVKQKWVNGSAVLIARRGKIVFYKAHGYNDPATKEPLDKNGIFRIPAQTKAPRAAPAVTLAHQATLPRPPPLSQSL